MHKKENNEKRAIIAQAHFFPNWKNEMNNICLHCGACCAAFRVTFHYSELESEGGCVPDSLADAETSTLYRLRGTDYARPRCAALCGEIGVAVSCGIYPERPAPCRDFAPLAALGQFTTACNAARRRHGLPPLQDE